MPDLADVAAAKAMRRVLPIVMICYFFAYLDRVNISFASLKMNDDLHLSAGAFGWALGIFFIGYFFFEVPSNLALEKFGARLWIARIMISWGLLSAAMAFVWNDVSLYSMRFIFGIAEAGFFPGVILYLTYWFPQELRGKIVGLFMVAIPVSSVIGAPMSSWILDALNGTLGLKGWQWLFLIEGLPTCLLGFVILFVMVDGPAKASWLTPEERAALAAKLAEDRRQCEKVRHFTLREALTSPRVLALAFVYFGAVTALYAVNGWLPQIIKGAFAGTSTMQIGLLTAVPAAIGAVAMVVWGRHSDATGERSWHIALPCFIGAAGLALSALLPAVTNQMIALTLASATIYCVISLFWSLPTSLLTGTAAAGGIALINSIGNLGGLVGPNALGQSKQWTGEFTAGLLFLAVLILGAGVTVVMLARRPVATENARVAVGMGR